MKCSRPTPAIAATLIAGSAGRRAAAPVRSAAGVKQTRPIGTVIAIAWMTVPVTTPRRAAALLNAMVAADRIPRSAPSMSFAGPVLGRFPARQRARVADRRDVGAIILRLAATEYGGAGDQHVGAGAGDERRSLGRDAAIDLEVDRPAADQCAQPRDFLRRPRDEGLAAEAGIDRHHEDQVDQVDHVLDRAFRRARIERDAGLLAERADRLQRTMDVRTRLDMHRDGVG